MTPVATRRLLWDVRDVCFAGPVGRSHGVAEQRGVYADSDSESLQADPEWTSPQDQGLGPGLRRGGLFDCPEPLQPPSDLPHAFTDPLPPGARQNRVLTITGLDPSTGVDPS